MKQINRKGTKAYYETKRAHVSDPFTCYNSVADFVLESRQHGRYLPDYDDEWAGGSFKYACELLESGDLSAVPYAEKMADMINDSVDIAGYVPAWSLDVAGAFVCVPEYLAGSPECMYNQGETESTYSPLDICVDVTAPVEVSVSDMRRRGTLVLAACIALSRVRPINLYAYGSAWINRPMVRLSSPFDVSEVCAIFTSSVVSRHLFSGRGYKGGLEYGLAFNGTPFADWSHVERWAKQHLVEVGGMSPDCVVIGPGKIGKWDKMTDGDFIEELNEMIDRARSGI